MNAPPFVILAGGTSRRMGGQDKALVPLGGAPLLRHVIDRVGPQGGKMAINTMSQDVAQAFPDLQCIADTVEGRPGPLAGILTAMLWAEDSDFVITVPADAPFLPGDLIPRLMLAADDPSKTSAFASCADRVHPVCSLWPTADAERLRKAIDGGMRKVRDWTDMVGAKSADFPSTDPDSFFNVNTPEDLTRAQQYLDQSQ